MSRQIGGVVGPIMIAGLAVPPVIGLMVLSGELSLAAALAGTAIAGLLVHMSTQAFLTVWRGSRELSAVALPEMVGARLPGAVGCSVIMVLIGYLIEVDGIA